MKKRYHLVLVLTKESNLRKEKRLLFLGKWCEIGLKNKKKLNYKILENPWESDLNKTQGNKIIKKKYKDLKKFLTLYLNKIHKKNFSELYWEQIFGHWLIHFISIYQERIYLIKKLDKYAIKNYNFIDLRDEDFTPNNSLAAQELFQNDLWNGYFSSILLNKIKPNIRFMKKKYKIKIKIFRKKNLKFRFLNFLKKIYSGIYKNFETKDKIFIISTYIGTLNEIRLQYKINGNLKIYENLSLHKSSNVNKSFRNYKISDCLKNSSTKFLRRLVIKFLPKSYLEDYSNYCSFLINKKIWPIKPKIVFTSNSHFVDDVFKIWLANQRENKTKLIIGQHGSGYLFPKYNTSLDRDIINCDKFLFWGKKNFANKRIKSNFNLLSINKKIVRKSKKNILMVQNFPNKYQNRLISAEHSLSDIYKNIELQKNFILLLNNELSNKVIIRLGSTDKFSNKILNYEREQWNLKEDISFETRDVSITKSFNKANLIIVNSIVSTVFLECLARNTPCFIISLFDREMFNRECFKDFYMLKKIGIIQNDSRNFASFINKNFRNIDEWWNTQRVQNVIRKFNNLYNRSVNDPVSFLANKIK